MRYFILMILGFWIFGYLLMYLKRKNKKLARIISVFLLSAFGILFIISTLGLFRIPPFYSWDIARWFAWPFQLVITIFLIITTIIINKD